MPPVSILIKPASSACNISCKYCFYHSIAECRETANFGIMSYETLETLVKETVRYADGFAAFAFQGGE
ncbi:MAG: anaerobic sulfatase maturase, partial [Porcipelethomonas sp.]